MRIAKIKYYLTWAAGFYIIYKGVAEFDDATSWIPLVRGAVWMLVGSTVFFLNLPPTPPKLNS